MGDARMKEERVSLRQALVTAYTGGLATAAAGAGESWQGALMALPGVLLAGCLLCAKAPRLRQLAGRPAGRTFNILYIIWSALLLARGLERCAGRTAQIGGGGAGAEGWLILLLAVLLAWVVRNKTAVLFRAAEIFYLAMGAILAAVLLWGATRGRWMYAAGTAEDLWGGAWSAVETGGTVLFVLPYIGDAAEAPAGKRRTAGWLGALLLTLVLMGAVTAAVLSPAVAAEMEEPFFLMAAALGESARLEGLISAVWLLADLVWLGLLAQRWNFRGMGKSWGPVAAVGLGAVGALWDVPGIFPEWFWGAGTVGLALATALMLCIAERNSGSEGRESQDIVGRKGVEKKDRKK